jgi:hypothetical protein
MYMLLAQQSRAEQTVSGDMAGTTEDRQLEKLTDAYIEKFRNSQFLSLFVRRRVFVFP